MDLKNRLKTLETLYQNLTTEIEQHIANRNVLQGSIQELKFLISEYEKDIQHGNE